MKTAKGFPCPCCGYLTRPERDFGTYAICPICGWEDDDVQASDPEFKGGANDISLNKAKENYRLFKTVSPRKKFQNREPLDEEVPSNEI